MLSLTGLEEKAGLGVGRGLAALGGGRGRLLS